MTRQDSVQGNVVADTSSIPVYQDELALSRFLEEYLDYFVEYIFKQRDIMQDPNKSQEEQSSETKVLLDLVKIFEMDRVVLKSFNTLVAMMILPEKDNIVRYLSKNCNDAVSMLDQAMPQS